MPAFTHQRPGGRGILIVDDDRDFGQLLRERVAAAGYDVQLTPSGTAARLALGRKPRDVVVLALPNLGGIELLSGLAEDAPGVPVLVFSSARSRTAIVRAIRAGARGYLLTEDTAKRLVPALAELLAGGAPMSNVVAATLLAEIRDPDGPRSCAPDPEAASLTPRERDTLTWLASGLTYQQVGVALGISEHTVRTHVRSIYPKLGAQCRTEAVMTGLRLGLVTV